MKCPECGTIMEAVGLEEVGSSKRVRHSCPECGKHYCCTDSTETEPMASAPHMPLDRWFNQRPEERVGLAHA